ncbi:MAG: hypothetical protein F6K39_38790 [Okeania sp. SIO3B3]|nr:hypothetical protein [Okeania sp. SIO3B3]
MTNNTPNTTAVEVNGIRFETRLNNSVIPLPPKEENAMTEVEFEIVVTNNTSNTFYFDFGYNLMPKLITSDNQIFFDSGSSDWVSESEESHFLLCKPGETVTFLDNAAVMYLENEFSLLLASQIGISWNYGPLSVGTHQLEFVYISSESKVKARVNQSIESKIIENVWTGEVDLPPLELHLVDPSI